MGVIAKRSMTKTRRRLRDVDQIKADLTNPRHLQLFKETKAPEDLPGFGKHYCIECAKWFESETGLTVHTKGKPHKRRWVVVLIWRASSDIPTLDRLKQLREGPYTHKEADAAVGLWTDNGKERTKSQEIEMSWEQMNSRFTSYGVSFSWCILGRV
jgi:bud site selection protein 20